MTYKIVIPSAGLGTRIGPYSKFLNKALVTIGDKPAIARVIDKFGPKVPIVILLGYKGDMIQEAVTQLYPNRNIEFISVDNFDGKGSGLGHTLLQAKDVLQCPFIFIPNDTIIGSDQIDRDPNLFGNWASYFLKTSQDQYNPEVFRCLELSEDKKEVTSITGKGTLNPNIYIGVCGVRDYRDFWAAMGAAEAVSVGEVFGLRALAYVTPIKVSEWYDCGSLQYLHIAKEKFRSPDHNILEKEDEAIWFLDDSVIKFSIDEKFIHDRVERLHYLPKSLTPTLLASGKYTYTYKKVEGEVISDTLTTDKLLRLLDICHDQMWSKTVDITEEIKSQCYSFYKDKTYSRVLHYCQRFEQNDDPKIINDIKVPSVAELLSSVDWVGLCGQPNWSPFHGDFHGENILMTPESSFILLDWRQSFGEHSKELGDAYYDLAKLRHGLLVNHGLVNADRFTIRENHHNNVFISIDQHSNLVECTESFDSWLEAHSFDPMRVKILTALIFLNICGLHEYPYARFLYLYGQSLLNQCLHNK